MSKRVLWLVDDDKIFHDIIRLTLEQIDSSVMFKGFSSADDFLDQLKETDTANLPDIILMDIMMPDKDCW